MQFHTHGNGHGMNDLYCLPETQKEQERLKKWLTDNEQKMVIWQYSNIQGQNWYGKIFFTILFGEYLKSKIIKEVIKEG